MRWLRLAEVLELHRRLIQQSESMAGLRDLGLLEASLAQPRQSFYSLPLKPPEVRIGAPIHHRDEIRG